MRVSVIKKNPEKPVSVNTYAALVKELDIRMSFLNPNTTQRAIDLLAGGALDVDAIISREMTAEEMLTELENRVWSRQGKVLLKWKEF